jgi:hypothetical protein
MKKILLLIAVTSLSGCLFDSTQVRITPEHAATIKRVGVISLVDKYPYIHYASTSVMESSFPKAVLKGWDAEREIQDLLRVRLKAKGFEVVSIPRDKGLQAAYRTSWSYADPEAIHSQLYQIGQANAVDMVVVVYRQVTDDFIAKTNQNVRGYGIYKAFDSEPFAYAAVMIEAVNVKRKFVMGRAEAQKAVPITPTVWQSAWEGAKRPTLIPEDKVAYVTEKIKEVLLTSVMIAGQETGISN